MLMDDRCTCYIHKTLITRSSMHSYCAPAVSWSTKQSPVTFRMLDAWYQFPLYQCKMEFAKSY